VLVRQQWGVDVPEHLPALKRVGELRVDVVRKGGHGDVDVATAATAAASTLLTAAARRDTERCQGGDANDG
jgi:hypothetical protein